MSLTNPNTVVTEERLSDFYKGILPYLGGMPEMVANKFSKGDLYSTDEKMIGQWIDGKPVYQKVIQTTIPSVGGDSTVSITSLSAENIILVRGIEYNFDTAPAFNQYMSGGESSGFGSRIQVFTTTSTLYVRNIGYTNSVGHAIYVILQYTKTTDSPISIGNDTDYSTDEKIVGTWIDGKPLYQRTVNVGSVSAGTTKTVDFNGIDMVCAFSGVAHSQAYNQQIPIVFGHQNMTNYVVNVLYTENNNKINVYTGDDFSLDWCFITIQYTKITD